MVRSFTLVVLSIMIMAYGPVQHEKEGSMTVEGEFEVILNPTEDENYDVGRMTIDKKFFGALDGVTKGQMLSHRSTTAGSAGYVAIEHFSGSLDGKMGMFSLQHSGIMQGETQSLTITVVPDSGTGELTGISGSMDIEIKDGKHFYEFTYSLNK